MHTVWELQYATLNTEQVAASELHVQQPYMCKAGQCIDQTTARPEQVICPGHAGFWNWSSQQQIWQLRSNPQIVTKVVPRNVLELGALLGSLPTHWDTVPHNITHIMSW